MQRVKYTCKDCKNSFVSLFERIFSFGILHSAQYKCRVGIENPKPNVVTGDTTITFQSCWLSREYGPCYDATLWEPRHKKDLFKYIAKDNHV